MTKTLTAAALALSLFAASREAGAAALNSPGCKPTAARPHPVVVVHGQAGNFEGMSAVTGALVRDGYCVYAKNYGYVPGGANGQDHLSTSADQIRAFVDQVLAQTGAAKVDVVGHSAGTGVLDNFILKKGGSAKVHRMVSFGGLHHPYAHVGIAQFADASLYLPNMIAAARRVVPGISAQDVVKTALDVYAAAGAPLGMVDPALRATMESNFTEDLFDPVYWEDLYGGQSEAPLTFVTAGGSERSLPTNDSSPSVCYTNIVAVADLVTGAAAGFQDEAPNVENFLLATTVTTNAHNDMLGDPVALGKMLAGLAAPCAPAPPKASFAGPPEGDPNDGEAAGAFEDALDDGDGRSSPRRTRPVLGGSEGCATTPRGTTSGAFAPVIAFAAAIAAWRRRFTASDRSRSTRCRRSPPCTPRCRCMPSPPPARTASRCRGS